MEYPIKLKEYLHSDKLGETDTPDELEAQGYDISNLPRYLVYELEVDIEIDGDGNSVITHVQGQKLATPISA
jgi:hypothetical protein